MTKPSLEWDYDNPKHRQSRRRPHPPLEGEILEPQSESEPRIHVNVNVHHRRSGNLPRFVIVGALLILAVIMLRSPGALILLGALIPSTVWIALAIIIAILVLVSIRERLAGRDL
jgi:hypothetical protein